MARLTILRGLSGSGKTTYADKHYQGAVVCSADSYMMEDGEYRFDPSKLDAAHTACFSRADRAASEGHDVVIDNTNSMRWEMSPYVMLAKAYDMELEIVRLVCGGAETAHSRSVHGSPLESVITMAAQFEETLPFWPAEKIVYTGGSL